mgnify:CR=1 FL=1
MYRLMIVDDEPIIVNSLYQFFVEDTDLELQIYRAYSAKDALDIARTTRLDIMITDICMPVMDGMELQENIRSIWPRCKFIYLTSYDKVEFAQQAIRSSAVVDFVLKNEENDVIRDAVVKAIGEIEQDETNQELVNRIQQSMRQAVPLLQKDFLIDLIQGIARADASLAVKFSEWNIPLQADSRVLLFVCRIDRFGERFALADYKLLHFAVENVISEYLSHRARTVTIGIDPYHLVCFLQPAGGEDWEAVRTFAYDTLESVQEACRKILKTKLSVIMSDEPCEWREVAEKFSCLKSTLYELQGISQALLLMDQASDRSKGRDREQAAQEQRLQQKLHQVRLLQQLLETRQREAFFELFEDTMEIGSGFKYAHLIELHTSIKLMFISSLNRMRLMDEAALSFDLTREFGLTEQAPWPELVNKWKELAELIFRTASNENRNKVNRIIDSVNRYVEAHLQDDLSLTRVAGLVFHSPTYFSKLYKKVTGTGFSEYVMERRLQKGAELLRTTNLKVGEVAASVGFESVAYFIRAFKKKHSVTPQEYRDRCQTVVL